MKNLVLALFLTFVAASGHAEVTASESVRSLSGIYTAYFTGGVANMKVTFAINSKLQIQVMESDPEYTEASVSLDAIDGSLGPVTLPIATIYFSTGSDEETMGYVLRVSFEKDGFVKVRYVDALATFNDGPNDSSHITRASAKLYKKSTKTGKFFQIK